MTSTRRKRGIGYSENDQDAMLEKQKKCYIELYELEMAFETGEERWEEKGRWMKYEETPEGKDNHWSRPHVPCLHTHALLKLRDLLRDGILMLDVNANTFGDLLLEMDAAISNHPPFDQNAAVQITETISRNRKHVEEGEESHDTAMMIRKFSRAVIHRPRSPSELLHHQAHHPYPAHHQHASSVNSTTTNDHQQQHLGSSMEELGIDGHHLHSTINKKSGSVGESTAASQASLGSGAGLTVSFLPSGAAAAAGNSNNTNNSKTATFQLHDRSRENSTLHDPMHINLDVLSEEDETGAGENDRMLAGGGGVAADDSKSMEDVSGKSTTVRFSVGAKPSSPLLSGARRSHPHQLHHTPQHLSVPHPVDHPQQQQSKSSLSPTSFLSVQQQSGSMTRSKSAPKIGRKVSVAVQMMFSSDTNEGAIRNYREVRNESFVNNLCKKIPENSEAVQVYTGVLRELPAATFVMIRMAPNNCGYNELFPIGAGVPLKFLFVILGPNSDASDTDYYQIGRSISTLMANQDFQRVAHEAKTKEEIIAGLDSFISASVVIPPIQIDYDDLIRAEDIKKQLNKRALRKDLNERTSSAAPTSPVITVNGQTKDQKDINFNNEEFLLQTDEEGEGSGKKRGHPLKRTGRIFGGLIDDIRYRLPEYKSDIVDGFNVQCIASAIFIFFAAFAPAITFGGLIGDYTHNAMGVTETLIAQCLCGVIWGVFAGQPLMIMSVTGPVVVFEGSLYKFCHSLGLNFMTIRVWAGLWLFLISLITVAFEGSFLISYFTAFTEDIFSSLISIIFIAESIKFLVKTLQKHPVKHLFYYTESYSHCMAGGSNTNSSGDLLLNNFSNQTNELFLHDYNNAVNLTGGLLMNSSDYYSHQHGGDDDSAFPYPSHHHQPYSEAGLLLKNCAHYHQPDTGLLTAIMMVATFSIALVFNVMRDQKFLGRHIRTKLADFGVLIAIIIVTLVDIFVFPEPYLKRLKMPFSIGFTDPAERGAGLFIPFALPADQWFGYLFAIVPALLVYILLFVETEVAELILSKKERGMRKGTGFHWDLLLCGFLAFLCGVFGLPWMCAAAVQSLAHGTSLTVMKRACPGEKPRVDHVIEQRLTTIIVALLVGGCAFLGTYLSKLPEAVLFGVFLYLGVLNLVPIEFIQRIVLFLVPEKYFPPMPYCEEVGMWRMHLYTLIQILCLAGIYLVKTFKSISLAFPFALMLIALLRMTLLPKIFTKQELEALDEQESLDGDDKVHLLS